MWGWERGRRDACSIFLHHTTCRQHNSFMASCFNLPKKESLHSTMTEEQIPMQLHSYSIPRGWSRRGVQTLELKQSVCNGQKISHLKGGADSQDQPLISLSLHAKHVIALAIAFFKPLCQHYWLHAHIYCRGTYRHKSLDFVLEDEMATMTSTG